MDPRPDDPDEPHGSAEPAGAVPSPPPPPGADDAPAPAPPPLDSDAAFRAIVEGYGRSSDAPVPPWPVEEDVDPEPKRRRSDGPSAAPPPSRRRPDPAEAGLPGWVEPAPVEDDNHFVPPPPPPAPRVRPRTVAAVAAVVLGVVLLFAPALLDVAPGAGTSFLGLLISAGGAGAIVYWMRDTPGPPDDGAVV